MPEAKKQYVTPFDLERARESCRSDRPPLIDRVRAYWDQSPCNIHHSDKPVGTKEYFDEVEKKKYFVEPHILEFAEFEKWRGKRVLEIGCGIGTDTVNFLRHGARVTAVELSQCSLDLTRQRLQHFQEQEWARGYDLVQANCEELNPAACFWTPCDLIYSFGVLHHTPNPERAIPILRKLLMSSGELRLMLYSKMSYKLFQVMHQTGIWDMSRAEDLLCHYSEAKSGSPYTRLYSREDIEKLLAPHFKVERVEKRHIFTWDIEAYRQGRYVKSAEWVAVSAERLAELEAELGWHTLVWARPA